MIRIRKALVAASVATALFAISPANAQGWGNNGWDRGGDWMPWGNNGWGNSGPWSGRNAPWGGNNGPWGGGKPWGNNAPWGNSAPWGGNAPWSNGGDGWNMNSDRGPWSNGPWGNNRNGMGWGGNRSNPWDWGPWDNDRWKGDKAPWNSDFPWQKRQAFRGWGPVPEKRRGIGLPPRYPQPPAQPPSGVNPTQPPAADAQTAPPQN